MSERKPQTSPSPIPNEPEKKETPPNTLEERLAVTLYLAGEALVPGQSAKPAPHAIAKDERDAPLIDDFQWLTALTEQIREAVAEDPKRAELLRLLPTRLAKGEILEVLFGHLWPEQRNTRKVFPNAKGKPQLTDEQVTILTEVARGKSNQDIETERNLSHGYVGSALQNINRKLKTTNRYQAIAVGISMGYLPFDVMTYVWDVGGAGARDYSPLDSLITYLFDVDKATEPDYWQQLAAFGLMLMIASNAAVHPQLVAAEKATMNGALYRLDRQPDGAYQTHDVVGPGQLRAPEGIAIAPPAARRHGFSPASLYILHDRVTLSGRNTQEIVVFAPDGTVQDTFCGARGNKTKLQSGQGLTFAPSGALLVTSDNAVLRFTEGGRAVQWRIDGCCTDVCTDREGNAYVAHSSSRGGHLGVYTNRATRKFASEPLPPRENYCGVRLTGTGEITALCWHGQEMFMEFYSAEARFLRRWQVPDGCCGPFALDTATNLLYLPNRLTHEVLVYTLAGSLQQRIALDTRFTPSAIALGSNGSLWLTGIIRVET